jgi:hypothetical protein
VIRNLSNRDVLRIWETGLVQHPVDRALTILAAAYPEETPEAQASLPIGRRDARLFAIRDATFGSRLDCLATCPNCGDSVELSLDASSLLTNPGIGNSAEDEYRVEREGWRIAFRLPTSRDLTEVMAAEHSGNEQRLLARRCITSIQQNGNRSQLSALDGSILIAISAEMAARDPNALIELVVTCPACQAEWRALFDIASFLWIEIDALAKRLLREVASLAHAYGWREADVLALSPARRQAYLDLL